MIRARVRQGRVEIQDPIPEDWEGQSVKILRMTPDDPLPDLEERLAALQALVPAEFDPDERNLAARLLAEQDLTSCAVRNGDNPWMKIAGMFKDDPLFNEWQQAIAEYRQK